MNLGEMFQSDVVTSAPSDSIRRVVNKMRDKNVGAVVITEGKKLVGIVTDRDVAIDLSLPGSSADRPVREIMTKDVHSVWDDQGIFNATQAFLGYKVRRLPIINHDGELMGIVTLDDIMSLLSREMHNVCRSIGPAIQEEDPVMSGFRPIT